MASSGLFHCSKTTAKDGSVFTYVMHTMDYDGDYKGHNVPENLLGSIWRQVGDPQKRYQKVINSRLIQNWA